MDVHENARLTPKGREAMVRAVVENHMTKAAAARQFNTALKPGMPSAAMVATAPAPAAAAPATYALWPMARASRSSSSWLGVSLRTVLFTNAAAAMAGAAAINPTPATAPPPITPPTVARPHISPAPDVATVVAAANAGPTDNAAFTAAAAMAALPVTVALST
jgi:leucine-zipper of insertion element IS481